MIVTQVQARQAIMRKFTELRASYGSQVEVEADGAKAIDLSKQSEPYMTISVVYMDGEQIGMARRPKHRAMGQIVLEAVYKEGTGVQKAEGLLEHFYRGMHMTDSMFPVRTHAAKFKSLPVKQGWGVRAALIFFWYDTD